MVQFQAIKCLLDNPIQEFMGSQEKAGMFRMDRFGLDCKRGWPGFDRGVLSSGDVQVYKEIESRHSLGWKSPPGSSSSPSPAKATTKPCPQMPHLRVC